MSLFTRQIAYNLQFVVNVLRGLCGSASFRYVHRGIEQGRVLLTQSGVSLQVALSIQGAGEGDVVQGAWWGIAANVLGHAADTVLCLLWGQLPPQLLHRDVGLQ